MYQVKLGNIELESPLIAAASSATARLDDLKTLDRTAIGAITTKSATMLARAGNPETNYFSHGDLHTNAQGLPGPDLHGTILGLERFALTRQKPLILSVAGMRPGEYYEIVSDVKDGIGALFDAIELNLSCPNVSGKPIISYDIDTSINIISEIAGEFPRIPFGLKLAPFFSETEQEELRQQLSDYLADNLQGYQVGFGNTAFHDRDKLRTFAQNLRNLKKTRPNINFVTATNTMPNCRLTDAEGKTVLHPKSNNGQGGLSGKFLRDVSLANVKTLAEEFRGEIPIIGTGGVDSGISARIYMRSGATAVAIGTALVNRGPKAVEEILLEL